MKSLPIQSPAYKYIEQSFTQWLDVLGYAEQTVYSMPNYVRGLLHYIEEHGGREIKHITAQVVRDYYYNHLKVRANKRWGGALSNNHLNKHIQAFKVFFDYLRQSGRQTLPCLNIPMEENDAKLPAVLTEGEIKSLFAACDMYAPGSRNSKPDWFYPAMALRDKAMLSVYYSCGLRRNEGVHVELNDVFFEKQLLHVRKGKNNKERFVPISRTALKHLENYLYDARPLLLKYKRSECFFINERGNPMSNQMMIVRLRTLLSRTENATLQEKQPGLHTLRHSIATHLLANGMKLEKIKDFLGHSSLESTQIYTHLMEKENADTDNNTNELQAGKVLRIPATEKIHF